VSSIDPSRHITVQFTSELAPPFNILYWVNPISLKKSGELRARTRIEQPDLVTLPLTSLYYCLPVNRTHRHTGHYAISRP
jgi:hypothetical protein